MGEVERVQIDEARRITGLKERTLQNLSARGEIWGAAKLGKRWTYDRQRLRAWVVANENAVLSRKISTSETVSFTPALRSEVRSGESPLERAIAKKRAFVSNDG